MSDLKIVAVRFVEEQATVYADERVIFTETGNGVIMALTKSRTLIPWHRIYSLEYERVQDVEEVLPEENEPHECEWFHCKVWVSYDNQPYCITHMPLNLSNAGAYSFKAKNRV